jgi:hypothetical protein
MLNVMYMGMSSGISTPGRLHVQGFLRCLVTMRSSSYFLFIHLAVEARNCQEEKIKEDTTVSGHGESYVNLSHLWTHRSPLTAHYTASVSLRDSEREVSEG